MDKNQERLEEAIGNFDVENVKKIIEEGVNINYAVPESHYAHPEHAVEYDHQPYSPLRLIIFRLADCNLKQEDMYAFLQITKMLLNAGVDTNNAMNYLYLDGYKPSASRNNKSYFSQILDEIYFAHQKSKFP